MTEHSPPPAPAGQEPPEKPLPPPRTVRLATMGVFVVAALVALTAITVSAGRDVLAAEFRATNPAYSQSEAKRIVGRFIWLSVGTGAVLVGPLVWFGVMTRRGRGWARIAVSLLLAIVLLLEVRGVLVGTGIVELVSVGMILLVVVVLGLLWLPAANRYVAIARAHRRRPALADPGDGARQP